MQIRNSGLENSSPLFFFYIPPFAILAAVIIPLLDSLGDDVEPPLTLVVDDLLSILFILILPLEIFPIPPEIFSRLPFYKHS